MIVANQPNRGYSRRLFWNDPDPADEALAWVSASTVSSSSVSGLPTADLQCDFKAT
jgi:hypothetical protein